MTEIVIVNQSDEIIGHKERRLITPDDIYRVSSLWITNSDGDILLAQRKLTKKHDPDKWGPAVAGTVDRGESYDSTIIKEAREELGLIDISVVKSVKRRVSDEYNYFCQWHTLVIDKPARDFIIQEDEVEQVKWFKRADLEEELRLYPEKFLAEFSWTLENL